MDSAFFFSGRFSVTTATPWSSGPVSRANDEFNAPPG
jgi:hypothetical protein